MNELANNQGGVRVILEDFSEKDWSVHDRREVARPIKAPKGL